MSLFRKRLTMKNVASDDLSTRFRGVIAPASQVTAGMLLCLPLACSSSDTCGTSTIIGEPPYFAEGRMVVELDPRDASLGSCPTSFTAALGEGFSIHATSAGTVPDDGPWHLYLTAVPQGVAANHNNTAGRTVLWVDYVTGAGDFELDSIALNLQATCAQDSLNYAPPILTGTLHIEHISATCIVPEDRSRVDGRGRPPDCALDAAGTLTVQGSDKAGRIFHKMTAEFNLVQHPVCPE